MLTLDRQARKALSSLSSSVTKLKAINAAFNAILDPSSLSLSLYHRNSDGGSGRQPEIDKTDVLGLGQFVNTKNHKFLIHSICLRCLPRKRKKRKDFIPMAEVNLSTELTDIALDI